ncbi:MAG: helix-turn-helix domain-containing protein [Cyclobacteriaceae bacterium]
MHQARKRLLEERLSVYEVSEMAGYKNPQHFSTAFKKFFGFNPSRLKS